MRANRPPATLVICASLPAGGVLAAARSIERAAAAGVPVTWACRGEDLGPLSAAIDRAGDGDPAILLDAARVASRPDLRHDLGVVRETSGLAAAVIAGTPRLDHRPLFVEYGIHAVAVGGFDEVTRSSRRPPPAGWACRSVVWGLWEVRAVPRPPRSSLSRLLPGFRVRLAPGGLTVVHLDLAGAGAGRATGDLERLVQWAGRQRSGVRVVRLAELPRLLQAGGQPDSGSVLRRAA